MITICTTKEDCTLPVNSKWWCFHPYNQKLANYHCVRIVQTTLHHCVLWEYELFLREIDSYRKLTWFKHRQTKMHTGTHRHIQSHTHWHIHRQAQTQTHRHTDTHTHTDTHADTQTQTQTHTHTDTHTHTHTQTHTQQHL